MDHTEALLKARDALLALNMPMGVWQCEARNSALDAISKVLAAQPPAPAVAADEPISQQYLREQVDKQMVGVRAALAQRQQHQAVEVWAGLSASQEPKYTVNGHAIVNRASGEAIPADEPVFIFRARDAHAMYALRDYLSRLPLGTSHRKAVEQRVMDFFDFKAAHPGRMKEPDTEPAALNPLSQPTQSAQPQAVQPLTAHEAGRLITRVTGWETPLPSQYQIVRAVEEHYGISATKGGE